MAHTAATCPCGTDRSIVTSAAASTRSLPANTSRTAVIAAAGRWERVRHRLVADLAVLTKGSAQQVRLVDPFHPVLTDVVTTLGCHVDRAVLRHRDGWCGSVRCRWW